MMVLSGKAGEGGGYDFRANAIARGRAGNIVRQARGSTRRVLRRAGHCLLAEKYLFQGASGRASGMAEKIAARVVFVSRPASGAPEPTSSSGGALTEPV
jgi:hypothetical protein